MLRTFVILAFCLYWIVARTSPGNETTVEGVASGEEGAAEAPRRAEVAIAFAGGGFRAFAINVGLTAGVLAVRADNSTAPTFVDTKFLVRFDTISTNSGSTWFWAQLAYSDRFQTTLERMAASPKNAAAEFKRSWMDDWVAVGEANEKRRAATGEARRPGMPEELAKEGGDLALGQAITELSFFWRRGLSWNDFVHLLLKTTTGVDSLHVLGDPVPSWLEGKVWLSVHSVVTGTPSKEARLSTSFGQAARYHDSLAERYGDALPVYLPAKHSIVFGSGASAVAPYPYFAPSSMATHGRSLNYRGTNMFGARRWDEQSAPLEQLGASVEAASGALPISGVAAASSAVAGGVCLSSSASSITDALSSQLTPWAALALPGGSMFSAGTSCHLDLEDKGVSRGRLRICARSGVAGVVDGGYTEGSGVAQAVASGAGEVVAVVNDLVSISGLFQRRSGSSETLGIPRLHLPIFAEWYGESLFEDAQHLWIPEGSEFLKQFMVATVRGTTIKNDLFGVEAGRNVTLRVVYVKTDLQIGMLSDYARYGGLAQEIELCMLSKANAEVMAGWFLRYV
mmetsp:Transcript_115987/g.334933  ORF Transcript_115987/g.334933 Transcript_115987/m.334933 type:complete len:568 (+) Transcript_115987:108-1811(+)